MPFVHTIPASMNTGPALVDAWDRFGEVVAQAETGLAALDDGLHLQIEAANGDLIGSVPAADVKRKFANLTWTLATGGVDNGGVGEVASHFAKPGKLESWDRATAAVQTGGLIGYDQLHALGLHYLALHETAHITLLGLQTWYDCWTDYVKTGADPHAYANSAQWTYNEAVANQIARVVGRAIGFAEIDNPGGGFPMVRNHLGLMVA